MTWIIKAVDGQYLHSFAYCDVSWVTSQSMAWRFEDRNQAITIAKRFRAGVRLLTATGTAKFIRKTEDRMARVEAITARTVELASTIQKLSFGGERSRTT